MDSLPRVKLSGALEGGYVVLAECGGGRFMIAPERPDGLPKLVALKRTTWACPTQWEGELEDGRALYARCRHGELSVGIGAGLDAAVANSMSKDALCRDLVEEAPMSFEELRAHLHGLLELPEGLEAEGQGEPSWDLEAFERIFPSEESADPDPAREGRSSESSAEMSGTEAKSRGAQRAHGRRD